MEFGVVGLGKMGSSLSLHAARKGMLVVGTSRKVRDEELLVKSGISIAPDLAGLVALLTATPRKIFLYVPAGPAIDQVIDELVPLLTKGDIIVDAGNSHFRDSKARHDRLFQKGIGFVDCGSSGGPAGVLSGGCFMVGGNKSDVQQIAPILRALAVPEGFIHAGPPGAGHFVKLIHNAIEFGMLQAIGEGVALLKASEYPLDLPALFHNWAHGSVIRGWLVELMEKGLTQFPDFDLIPSFVEDTGEVNWVLQEAIRSEVAVPVIAMSVMELFSSRDQTKVAHRAVSILRHEFGGHPIGRDTAVAAERRGGHVGQGSAA